MKLKFARARHLANLALKNLEEIFDYRPSCINHFAALRQSFAKGKDPVSSRQEWLELIRRIFEHFRAKSEQNWEQRRKKFTILLVAFLSFLPDEEIDWYLDQLGLEDARTVVCSSRFRVTVFTKQNASSVSLIAILHYWRKYGSEIFKGPEWERPTTCELLVVEGFTIDKQDLKFFPELAELRQNYYQWVVETRCRLKPEEATPEEVYYALLSSHPDNLLLSREQEVEIIRKAIEVLLERLKKFLPEIIESAEKHALFFGFENEDDKFEDIETMFSFEGSWPRLLLRKALEVEYSDLFFKLGMDRTGYRVSNLQKKKKYLAEKELEESSNLFQFVSEASLEEVSQEEVEYTLPISVFSVLVQETERLHRDVL